MSGWDTPSRPTWDPQDGPEDSTQAFSAPDLSGADDRWSQPAGSGWGGPGSADGQDFGRADYGVPDFSAPDFGSGSTAAFPPDQNGFAHGGAPSSPPSEFFPQEFEQRRPGATLAGRDLPGRDGYGAGTQVPARDEPSWPSPSRQQPERQQPERQEYGRTGEYGRPDLGRADLDRQGASGQDFPRRDPARVDYAAYATYSAQPDQAQQAPPPPAASGPDAELAARMDPALQDFFAPPKPDPRYSSARPGPGPGGQPPGLPGSGLPGPGLPGPVQSGPASSGPGRQQPRRGAERGPQRPARPADPWEDPASYPSPGTAPRNGQHRPASHGGRRAEDELTPGGKRNRVLAICAVAVVVVAGGAYLALHKSPSSSAAGGATPTVSASTSAPAATASAKPTTKKKSAKKSGLNGSATSTGGYVLSTPPVAGGYPIGTDPDFLATTTATAAIIEQSAISGGGGTVAGSPVSASYTLPDEQTIEFVGYQGTFNPTTVMTNLGTFGSTESTYPAGKNGGQLACANVPATATTPAGAVCVWVTKSTLGFTEFFDDSGPEILTQYQYKGANDTVNLRSGVETLKS